MSGLFGVLSTALSSLSVSQDEIRTTSNNVANANTPGYSRQVPEVAAGAPISLGSLSFGTGVVLQKIQSVRDSILEIQLNTQTQQQNKLDTSLAQLQQMQTQFGSATTGIGADISNFFKTLQQLAPDPSNLALRQSVLTAATTLSNDFHTTASSLQTQRANIDLNVVQSVNQVNTLTSQIANVNQQISTLKNSGEDPGTLVDTQNNLIRQLSALVDVSVIPTDQGISLALSNGTTLVSGAQSYSLSTGLGTDGVQHIFDGSTDITGAVAGGSIAGLIQVRDQEIPALGTSLDQLAAGLATNLNTANRTGIDLSGNAGGNLFLPPPAGGVGAAAAFTVAITDPALIAASSDGTSGSNGNLAVLSAVATEPLANGQTPIDSYSSIVFKVGNDTSNTSADSASSSLILQHLQDQRGSVSGVSLDEEAANLIKYQTAYQAAARVVSAVNSLLSDAVNLGLASPVQ
jgi:flagellar hook-associated protein 1 FlgK